MAYIELQQRFWVKFLFEMGIYAKSHPYLIEIRDDMFLENGDVSFMDFEDRVVQPPVNIPGEKIFDWIKQKAGGPNNASEYDSTRKTETKAFSLMFNRIWDDETSQQYADTYYLIQSGVPSELRAQIWKDLLKIEVHEYEELRVFKKKH